MKFKIPYKWEVVVILWWAFFNNQTDRQAFNVVLPLIREDLMITDIQIGIIAMSFNLVFALFVPVAGYIGDLFSRKWILTISILFWSTATMMTGLSTGFLLLILFRCTTGAGESFFGPPNYSLIRSYHKKTISTAMSIFHTSYYVGMVLAGFMAGYIGERWGWRMVFYLFGAFGILNGIVMLFRLKDKKEETDDTTNIAEATTSTEAQKAREKVGFFDGFKVLFGTPTAVYLVIGFSIFIFVITGYLTWMPTYLYESFNMNLAQAGFYSMFFTHLFALIGILIAGKYSDRSALKNPSRRFLIQGLGLLVSAPFILLMGNSTVLPLIYLGFAGFGFGRAFFDANTYSVLYDVTPIRYRSSVSGVLIMCGFAVGSFSPLFLAYLRTYFNLSLGISVLSLLWGLAAFVVFYGYKYHFTRDYEKAKTIDAITEG